MKKLAAVALFFLLSPLGYADIAASRVAVMEDYPEKGQSYQVTVVVGSGGNIYFMGKPVVDNGTRSFVPTFQFTTRRSSIPELEAVLKKSVEWSRIAKEHNVQPFEKVIGKIEEVPIVYVYSAGEEKTQLKPIDLYAEFAPVILDALPSLAEAEKELAAKVAQAKKEDELFQ